MDKDTLKRYIGRLVILTLDNNFQYKLILKKEYIKDDTLSFVGKFGEPVDFKISEINFITVSKDDTHMEDIHD